MTEAPLAASDSEHEDLLQFLYLCPLGIVDFDASGQVAHINPAALNLLATTVGIQDARNIFTKLFDLWPDMQNAVAKSPETLGVIVPGHRLHGTTDGSSWAVMLRIVRVGDARYMLTVNDVSTTVALESQLQENEARFRALSDNSPLLVWAHDPLGDQEWVNDTYCEYFGVTRDEMLSDRWQMLTHPKGGTKYIDAFLASVADRTPFHGEVRVKDRDDRWRWLESWGTPRLDSDGNYLGHAGASVDITDRKRAERVLARDAAFTRRVLDNLFTFAGVLEIDGTVITANKAPLLAAGIGLDDVVGRKFWDCWWWTYSEPVVDEMRRAVERAAGGEGVRYDEEVRVIDDGRIPIDFQIAPLRNDDGEITHLVVSGLDLTERKRAQAELEAARWEAEILSVIAGQLSSAITPAAIGAVALDALGNVGAAAVDLVANGRIQRIAAADSHSGDQPGETVTVPCRSSEGKVIAEITLSIPRPSGFEEARTGFVEAVASLTAGALERALLHERSERRRVRAELLAGVMTAVESEGSVDAQLQRFATELVPAIGDFVVIESKDRSLLAIAHREPADTDALVTWWRHHPEPEMATVELDGIDASVFWGRETGFPDISDDDHLFMRDLSARVGLVISATRAFERERSASLRLQRALLPDRLATNPKIDIAALYEAATDQLKVGGDWYDTFTWTDGSYGVVIGDVVGHDVEAAAAMGRIRAVSNVLICESEPDPSTMLSILDRVARGPQGTRFATAFCAVINPDSNRIDYASAGHPPALLIGSDGEPRFLDDAQSPPLSTMAVENRAMGSTSIAPDDLLVFYSDGLIERRGEHIGQGLERLAEHVVDVAHLDVADVGATLAESLRSGPSDDDTVVVTLRFASTQPRLSLTVPSDSEELGAIRSKMRTWLADNSVSNDRTADVLLGSSEAVANAIEHAYAGANPETIHIRSSIRRGILHVSVQDHGRWLPVRIDHSHRGRGSQIMAGVADSFERRIQATGTTVHMTFDLSNEDVTA